MDEQKQEDETSDEEKKDDEEIKDDDEDNNNSNIDDSGTKALLVACQLGYVNQLEFKDILNVAITCKYPIFCYMGPRISEKYAFTQHDLTKAFQFYSPTKLEGVSNLNILPANITRLSLSASYNTPLPPLPPSLTQLDFGFCFNQPIDYLSPNITIISFTGIFNQPIKNLQPTVTAINFGDLSIFNKPIHLPPSLAFLKLSNRFNHPIQLPDTLEVIYFGEDFQQQLEYLPATIQSVYICETYLHPLPIDSEKVTRYPLSSIRIE